MVAVALADAMAPLGVAVFIMYMVPMALMFFAWRPKAPFVVAAFATVLIVVDFLLTPDGPERDIARLNRGFGAVTLWLVAAVGHQFILIRLAARKESWIQEGQTLLNSQLVGEQRLDQLGDRILRFAGEYMGAQAGVFFVKDGGVFRRHAVYGAAVESVPNEFAVGEGLVGQAAKDKRPFVIEAVPQGFWKTSSGLGSAVTSSLLVVPVTLDGEVNAVLELGHFGQVRQADQELVGRVEGLIGVAVRTVKFRMRLQELLEETQRQSEEVQAQSEELRVSNEELEEQSRAQRESQARLELQQAELEQINTLLEEQTQALERQKDELLTAKGTLERQARVVEEASRYKSDFLANMSHELRTPLNSSLILAKLLAENGNGNLNDEQVKYARTIESAGNDLLALINDVLDLSKIEAGHMEVRSEPFRMQRLIDGMRDTFEPVARQKALNLSIVAEAGTLEIVESDIQRLEQVLKNLMSNALKFTEKGGVEMIVSAQRDRVVFAVKDTGIGIAEDQQRTIFDPFFQADGASNRKYGGTGLGLSISRNLTQLLGGELSVRSVPGEGSVFTVEIPARAGGGRVEKAMEAVPERISEPKVPMELKTVAKPADDRETLSGNGRVILAVEDDEAFASIIHDLAHELDFQCLIATTAEEALALAQQYLPNAIVLDVGLPDNSGLLVLERLKGDSRTRHIPVHVVSASDYSQTALSLGAVGYMLKPVKREDLAETFRSLETKFTQKMRRVLLVEDDPVQIDALRDLLGSRQVDTMCVGTAAKCLEALQANTFDCMVLDLSLPDSSGFALLEKLSMEDAYSFPPVIVYTGRDLSGEEEQQLRKYSKSIIIKGAKSPERLLDEVSLFLHQVVSDLPPEKQRMIEKAGNRDAALEGRRILVAEDDVRNIFALTSLLESRGVKIQIARNGREAIEALEKSLTPEGMPVDLVLMDVMMPEMDGLTAMRGIRARPEWKRLPIIALTAKAMKNDQKDCIDAGANDYLAKPLDVEKLLSLIRVWMPR